MASGDPVLNYMLGMTVGSISMVTSSLGETLLRLSALRAQKAEAAGKPERPPWRRPLWYIAIICILVAAPLDAASFYLAPMSSIIVLYALKQPVLTVMARCILSERIQVLCGVGILLVALGAWVSLVFAPQEEPPKFEKPTDFFTTEVTVYLVVTAVSLSLLWCFVFCRRDKAAIQTEGVSLQDLCMPLISAWMLAASKLFNAGWGRLPEGSQWYELQWIWLVVGVVGLACGVFFVNVSGLERMSTHIFMPIGFGFTAVITGIQGVILGEFADMPQNDFYLWCGGMSLAVIGTGLVACGSSKGEKDKAEQEKFLDENARVLDQVELKLSILPDSGSQLGSGQLNV